MKTRGLFIASLILAAGLATLGWYAASQLPSGTLLPTHWNAAGQVDGMMPAGKALAFAPALVVLLAFLALPFLQIAPTAKTLVVITAVLVAAILPIVYSWWLWRNRSGEA